MAFSDNLDFTDPKKIFELVLYVFALPVFAITSYSLGFELILWLGALACLACAFFLRGWGLPYAALASYAASVAISNPSVSATSLALFAFNLVAFFVCFRAGMAKAKGLVPVEPFAAAVPAIVAGALFLLDWGVFLSSTESFSARGIFAASLFVLLFAALSVPLLAELWARIRALL